MNETNMGEMIDLKRLVLIAKSHWLLIVASILICALLSLAFASFFVESEYCANIDLIVNNSQTIQNETLTNSDVSASTELANTYAWIIKSHSTVDQIIKSMELDYDAESLLSHITVSAIEDTQIVRVSVVDNEPERARQIAQELSELAPKVIKEKIPAGNVVAVDNAWVSNRPVSPDKKRYFAAGGLAGLVISLLYIAIRQATKESFVSSSDVQNTLNLPVIGVIPVESAAGMGEKKRKRRRNTATGKFSAAKSSNSFAYKEAYKTLQANLEYSMLREDNSPKILIVTSAIPGEGKSHVAINLAYGFAAKHKRVILVDCDLRKGSVWDYLKLPRSEADLVSTVYGTAKLIDAIYQDKENGVDVLAIEDVPDMPDELLTRARFRAILTALAKHYDYVICDSAPINSVADTSIICRYADAVLLVVRYDYVHRSSVLLAKEQIERCRIPIEGVVFNAYDYDRESKNGNQSYDYYDYYSKNGNRKQKI